MAKLEGDKVVVKPSSPKSEDYGSLKAAAASQSPVSTINPEKYAKGK